MPKRKAKPIKRTRRSSFENSLEYATNKLDRCLERQSVIEKELESLKQEIPYLQGVIRALTPADQRQDTRPTAAFLGRTRERNLSTITPVPDTVKPFIEPISANVDALPSEEDKFLKDPIPGATDLLT